MYSLRKPLFLKEFNCHLQYPQLDILTHTSYGELSVFQTLNYISA